MEIGKIEFSKNNLVTIDSTSNKLDDISNLIQQGIINAENQHHAEKIAGNIVKENYWKGEATALHRLRHEIKEIP